MADLRLIYGFHAVTSRIRQNPDGVLEIYLQAQRSDPRMRDLIKLAETSGVRVIPVDAKRLDGMAGSARHQGVAARVDAARRVLHLEDVLDTLEEPPILLVLDGVQDPHNLGACLRSANAFGVHAVIAPKDRAVSLTDVVRKVSCGAAEQTPFIAVSNLNRTLKQLKEANVWLVGFDAEATVTLTEIDLKGHIALVMGGEGDGLRRLTRETCDYLAKIPMRGMVESLNVSVAT